MSVHTRGRKSKMAKAARDSFEIDDDTIEVTAASGRKKSSPVRSQRTLLPREQDSEFMFTETNNDETAYNLDYLRLPSRSNTYDEREDHISHSSYRDWPSDERGNCSKRRKLDDLSGNTTPHLSPSDGEWEHCGGYVDWAPESLDDTAISGSKDSSRTMKGSASGQGRSIDASTAAYLLSPPESIETSPTIAVNHDNGRIVDQDTLASTSNVHAFSLSQPRLKFTDGRVARMQRSGADGDEPTSGSPGRLQLYRERNRVAAKKCRSRKKAVTQKLEDTHDIEKATNEALKRQIMELRNELVGIRMEALAHTSTNRTCTCKRLHQYNHNKAMELSYSGVGTRAVWA